jgi:hypothetical protein
MISMQSQKEHVIIWCICAAYFSAALLVSPFPSGRAFHNIEFYFRIWLPFLLPFVFIFWAGKSIVFLLGNRSEGFIGLSRCWRDLRGDYLSKDAVFRFLMIFPLIPFFNFSYSSIKQTIPIFSGTTVDLKLHEIDYFLHGGNNPWDLLQPLFGYPFVTKILDQLYLIWAVLLLNTLFWMAFSKRRYLRQQFFLSLIFCWIIIGNVMARVLASAGPCYFSKVISSVPDPYAAMLNYLHSIPGLKAVQIQNGLWQAQTGGIFMPLGGISAMPSMHVSIAVLLALVFFHVNRYLGILFAFFAIIIQIGSVHLGWHYAIDGYVSTLLTILIWMAVKNFPFFRTGPKE